MEKKFFFKEENQRERYQYQQKKKKEVYHRSGELDDSYISFTGDELLVVRQFEEKYEKMFPIFHLMSTDFDIYKEKILMPVYGKVLNY